MTTTVNSEIAGKVWQIERQVGDRVEEEDTLLVLESMKMEIPVTAPVAGTIQEILVAEGDEIAEEQALVVLA